MPADSPMIECGTDEWTECKKCNGTGYAAVAALAHRPGDDTDAAKALRREGWDLRQVEVDALEAENKELRDKLAQRPGQPQGTGDTPPVLLFVATGHAYVKLFEVLQRAMREPNPRTALVNLVREMDEAASMWVTDHHDGLTLAQHWHNALASSSAQRGPQGGTPTDAGREASK